MLAYAGLENATTYFRYSLHLCRAAPFRCVTVVLHTSEIDRSATKSLLKSLPSIRRITATADNHVPGGWSRSDADHCSA